MRNLAGRSAKAAKETAELIEHSNSVVGNGMKVAETGDDDEGVDTEGEVAEGAESAAEQGEA